MKRLLLALALVPAVSLGQLPAPIAARGTVQAAFSPWDDAEGVVMDTIRRARRDIRVQAFSFTSRNVAAALIAARRRGVDVRVIADREQAASESSRLGELVAAGISVLIDAGQGSAHNKVMIVDSTGTEPAVVTGSYNWTYAARSRNAENILVLRGNPELAGAYLSNWQRHAERAQPLKRLR
jgi:phosphatidylserine/phosphatidylglycerophosphate/cardiolipin synthase-like enzyme